jgi:hypothetical protein
VRSFRLMATPLLSLRDLNRATLARQRLLAQDETSPPTLLEAVERLAGLQAQGPKPPFLGLWTRVPGFERQDLHRLFEEHRAVRATMMRGTIHLVSAADYRAFRPILAPVLQAGMESILKQRGQQLDVPALVAAAAAHIAAEGPRTFDEVRDHLLASNPGADERAMGYAVRMQLPLVLVPDGSAWSFPSIPRFALAESWLGEPIAEDAGPEVLLLRYLAAFGPASVADAQTWSGLKGLRPAFEALRPRLLTFRDERDRELFDLPEAPRPPADTPAPVRFLPEYDNLLLGHSDRRRIVADAHKPQVYLPALRVAATFLVDGQVAGSWKTETKRKAATLHLTPFVPLDKKIRQNLEQEGDRLLRFLEPEAQTYAVAIAEPA